MYRSVSNLWSFRRQPIGFMGRVREEQGDLARLPLGPHRFNFAFHPDHAQRILKDNVANYPKSRLVFDMIRPITGDEGLVQLSGDEWTRVRKATNPIFQSSAIDEYLPIIKHAIGRTFDEWDEKSVRGKAFDLCPGITELVLRISGQILFSADLADDCAELGEKFVEMNRICGERIRSLIYPPEFIPSPGNRRIKKRKEEIRELSRKLLVESARRGRDLIGAVAPLEGKEDFVISQMMTFLFAGHEATATSICWALYRLAQNPELQEKVRREIRENGREVTSAKDLLRWQWLVASYKEGMRLHPPAWILAREVKADDTLGETKVKAGTQLLLSLREIHRHPDFWDEPDEFRPERFLAENCRGRHPFSFVPFSAGPRVCSGAQLALVESVLVLARIVERYRFLPCPNTVVSTEEMITARPDPGVFIQAERIH